MLSKLIWYTCTGVHALHVSALMDDNYSFKVCGAVIKQDKLEDQIKILISLEEINVTVTSLNML